MLKNLIPTIVKNINSTRANILWATTLQVIEKTAGYFVIAALTRTLLQTELGTLFFTLSIAELTAVFLNFGTNTYLVRLVASDPQNSLAHLSRILSLRVTNTLIGYIVLNTGVWLIRPDLSPVMLFVSAYDFLEEIYYCFSAFFIGRKQLLYRLATLGGFKVLILLGVSLIAYITHALFPILWTYVLLDLLLVLVCYWIVRKQFGALTIRLNITDGVALMRKSAPFFLVNLLAILHMRFDTIMVGAMLTLRQVAIYELGIKLMEVTRFIVRPLTNVFFPLFSEYAAQERWRLFRTRFMLLIGLAFGAGIMLVVGIQVLGPHVIVWLFSESYRESIVPAQILFWSVPFLYTVTLSSIAANALHLEKKATLIAFISVVFNLGSNLILIPRFGIIGAAWATVASQALQAIGMLLLVLPILIKSRKSSHA